jgi:hypothetical protein
MFNVYKNQLSRQTERFWTHQIPTSCLPTLLIFIHIEHICSFFVAFFSATIDDRNLIFGHKLHIGTPYHGKCFWTHQIPTSCLPILLIFIHIEHICSFLCSFKHSPLCLLNNNKMNCELMLTYDTPALWQTGSRNLTGQKTLPTIWGTIMESVFGPIRFLLPVCRLSWFLYTLNIYAHFSSHFSQQLLMAEISTTTSLMNTTMYYANSKQQSCIVAFTIQLYF